MGFRPGENIPNTICPRPLQESNPRCPLSMWKRRGVVHRGIGLLERSALLVFTYRALWRPLTVDGDESRLHDEQESNSLRGLRKSV